MAEQNVLPLNRFQSVITDLTGEPDNVYNTPAGVSTIILSAQITNIGNQTENITISILSNRDLPVAEYDGIFVTSSMVSASALLDLNKEFVVGEVSAYINFQNNLLEVPLSLNLDFYRENVKRDIEAISYDVANNTTIRTTKTVDGYYDKNGVTLIPTNQFSASVSSIEYASYLVEQILKNESVTGSANVSRLYQTTITQSISEALIPESGSVFLVGRLYDVIKKGVENPKRVEQSPIELVNNIEIPVQDSLSPLAAGSLVLEEEYGLLISGSPNLKVVLSLLEAANE